MSKYKIEKALTHDYATVYEKIENKLRNVFYKLIKDRTRAYPFYRSYRHRNKLRANENAENTSHYMTEEPNSLAGFGHGLGSWRAGIVNSYRLGVSYAYSPMVNASWDEKLGLGERLPKAKDLLSSGYKKVRLPYYNMNSESSIELIKKIIASYDGEKVVFYNEHEQWTADGDDIFGDELIRDMFWKSEKRAKDILVYNNGTLINGTEISEIVNVALHIRRGDVKALLEQGDQTMLDRWLDNAYYAAIMNAIIECVGDESKVYFYVFSEGDKGQFSDLMTLSKNIEILTDLSAEDSFVNICYADIIVTAPSSFSITAGAISYGLKLYPDKDWLTIPNNEEWQKVHLDGTIDEDVKDIIKRTYTRI